jgi:hypothetical protein
MRARRVLFTWLAERGARLRHYRIGMSVSRRAAPGQALPRSPELLRWEGNWVAVRDGSVVAAAGTSLELVHELALLGPKARGAVVQKVPRPTDEIIVGMG